MSPSSTESFLKLYHIRCGVCFSGIRNHHDIRSLVWLPQSLWPSVWHSRRSININWIKESLLVAQVFLCWDSGSFSLFNWLHWVLVAAGRICLAVVRELSAVACGIQLPSWGSNSSPLHWELTVLAPEPPGKSPNSGSFILVFFPKWALLES